MPITARFVVFSRSSPGGGLDKGGEVPSPVTTDSARLQLIIYKNSIVFFDTMLFLFLDHISPIPDCFNGEILSLCMENNMRKELCIYDPPYPPTFFPFTITMFTVSISIFSHTRSATYGSFFR